MKESEKRLNHGRYYIIAPDHSSIRCLTCNRVSHNPNDVAHKYCGHCHQFHQDRELAEKQTDWED